MQYYVLGCRLISLFKSIEDFNFSRCLPSRAWKIKWEPKKCRFVSQYLDVIYTSHPGLGVSEFDHSVD